MGISLDRRNALMRLLALTVAPGMPCLARARPPQDDVDAVLLVASQAMADPRFRETVLMVMRHGPGGPLGVILNRPTRYPRGEVLQGFGALPDPQQPIYYGGPVAQNALFYIARFAIEPEEVLTLAAGVFMGRNLRRLAAMLDAGVRPQALRFYAGYAGWAPGQLENELSRQDWHLLPLEASVLFDDQPEGLYRRMIAQTRLIPA